MVDVCKECGADLLPIEIRPGHRNNWPRKLARKYHPRVRDGVKAILRVLDDGNQEFALAEFLDEWLAQGVTQVSE